MQLKSKNKNKSTSKNYNVEKGFISKLLEDKDMKLIKDQQIKSSFLTGENKRVFNFIQTQFRETSEVPTYRVLQQKFPNYEVETYLKDGYEIVGTEESLIYWCNQLHTKAMHNRTVDVVEKVAEKLDSGLSEEAFELMKKGVWQIEDEVVVSETVDITKNTEDRKQAYLERKDKKGMIGIPTGIDHLDYLLKGLQEETLTTIIAKSGIGKAVTLDTPILTPKGFVHMRDITVGSIVYDEKGNQTEVLAVYPQGKKQIYRVHFEDGTHVDCCKDHLWKFKTIDDVVRHNEWRIETTEQLLKRPIRRGQSFNLCVPVNEPIRYDKKDLPLDPYVLGCLLGDGGFTTDRISFTTPEKELVCKLNNLLKDFGEFVEHKGTIQYVFKSKNFKCNKLYRTIKDLGLIHHSSLNKFIPKEYLLSSYDQRLALLQGLIDTDGSVNVKGHVSFYTNSFDLKEDIMNLIRSLGFRCTSSSYNREDKTNAEYVVRIGSDLDIFFTSTKHKERYKNRKVPKRRNHYDILKITDIEVLDTYEEMQCITVASPYHTFICGDFIVTHNTWLLVLIGAYAQLNNYKVCVFITEMNTNQMRDRFEAMLFGMMCGDFDYNQFKSGTLPLDKEKEYFQFLEEDLPRLEPLILETATGVSGVVAVIEREKPDLVLIDGVYLMEDDQGAKDDWLRISHITRDLKKTAKRKKLPIVVNTQADKNTSKKTGPELDSIMYSQAIGQDSDNVLALYRDEIMINDGEMGIRVLKQREGTVGKSIINWDFKTMNFEGIYYEKGESNSPDSNSDTDDDEDNVLSFD